MQIRRPGPVPVFLVLLALISIGAAVAGAEWLQAETDHFKIIYQDSDVATAAELAGIADEVYADLAEYLGVEGALGDRTRRIPVVIRGDAADASGYFTFLPVRIVIYTATPSTPIVQPNLDEWLRIVFTHELTHYFQVTAPTGWGALSRIFGRSAALVNLVLMPRFLPEGLAVHTETALTAGGRGRSPVFEMQYVAALFAEDFWTFDQSLYGSDFAPRSRVYVGGYVMVDYVIRTFGMETLLAISREYLRRPLLGIRRAIHRATGLDALALYDAMLLDLEDRYGERAGLPVGALASPADDGYWYLIRGTTDMYGAPPRGYPGVLRRDAWTDGVDQSDSSGAVRLHADAFSLTSNDRIIVGVRPFTDLLRPSHWVGYTDLVVVNRETGASRRVTHGRRLYHPSLHPDGESVVAVERIGAYTRLVRVNLGTGGVNVLWAPDETWMGSPTVSPDGTQAALVASHNGEQDLYLVSLTGRGVTRLTSSIGLAEFFPVFVSDSTVWFTAAPDGPLALYELDLRSGSVTHLLTDREGVFYATPAGEGAVYASYSRTGPSVKTLDNLRRSAVEWPSGGVAASAVSPATVIPPGGVDAACAAALAPLANAQDPGTTSTVVVGSATRRRYLDWPIPDLWLPYLFPGRGVTGIGVDLGAVVVAGSPLEQTLGLLIASVNYPSLVPSVSLQLMQNAGPWQSSVNVASAPAYLDPQGLRAQLQSSLLAGVSREIARWGVLRRHGVTAALSGQIRSTSVEGYSLPDFLAATASNDVRVAASLGYAFSRERRLADLLGPAGFSASVTGTYSAALDEIGWPIGSETFGAAGEAGIRAPVGGAMAEMRAAVATGGYQPRIDTARGTEVPVVGGPGPAYVPAVVARIGMDTPARLLDAGWRGFSLTRIGASFYVQQAVDYGAGNLALRPETVAAVELVATAGYLSASLTPAIGVMVTVPHADLTQIRLGLTVRNASADPGLVIGN